MIAILYGYLKKMSTIKSIYTEIFLNLIEKNGEIDYTLFRNKNQGVNDE